MKHVLEEYLLKTNIPPPEVDYIRACELIQLEEEKLQLVDSLLEDLAQRKAQISAQLDSYKNVVSVARRSPPEIVAAIFRCSISTQLVEPKQDQDDPFPTGITYAAPLSLTQICSAWRQIAFRTQELWNQVSIYASRSTPKSTAAQVSLARNSMKRCRTLPYTLSLFMPGYSSSWKISDIIPIQPTTIGKLVLSVPLDDLLQLGSLPEGVTQGAPTGKFRHTHQDWVGSLRFLCCPNASRSGFAILGRNRPNPDTATSLDILLAYVARSLNLC